MIFGERKIYEKHFGVPKGSSNEWYRVILKFENETVLCATITIEEGQVFLYEIIDNSDQLHTTAYLTKLCCDLSLWGCKVYERPLVTDSTANMVGVKEKN